MKNVGNTSTVRLFDSVFAKIEGENPAGSVKDRAALFMIADALQNESLNENGCIVEATSGNTGIGLAYVAKELGIDTVIVMPENMSEQRRRMIEAYGAKLLLTPASEGMTGAVKVANKLRDEKGYWLADQFNNPSSIKAHFCTTAPEIFQTLPNVKYIVVGVGSGGTAMGIKKYIDCNDIDCKVIAVEPENSPLISKGYAGAHKIQGIGANFLPSILDASKLDGIITVGDDEAIDGAREIFKKHGLYCGISSGAAYVAAQSLLEHVDGQILAVFPDSGNRYSIFD